MRRGPRAGKIAWLAVAVLWAVIVPAAELPDAPATEDGFFHLGAFYLRPGLALSNFGYDSNIFLASEDAVGDLTATLSPRLESVNLFGHRGRLDLRQVFDLVGFLEYSSQNHINSNTRAEGRWLAGDFLVSGLMAFDTSRLRPNEEITERVRQKIGTIAGEVEWSRTQRSAVALSVDRDRYTYDDPSGEFGNSYSDLDRDEVTLAVDLRTRIRPKTDALLSLSRTDIRNRQPDLGRDAIIDRAMPGVRLDATAFLQGEVYFGLLELTPDSPGRNGYRGPGGRGVLTYRPLARLRLTAEYDRDVVFSIFGNDLYFLRQKVGLEATTPVTRRFHLSLGGARTHADYSTPVVSPTFTGIRADLIDEIWIGWSYIMPGRPRIGFKVESWDRTSNFAPANVSEIRILGEAVYEF